jgi:hypothetical protein
MQQAFVQPQPTHSSSQAAADNKQSQGISLPSVPAQPFILQKADIETQTVVDPGKYIPASQANQHLATKSLPAPFQLKSGANQPVVQRAYGPKSVTITDDKITKMDLHAGRPGVSSSIANHGRESYAYRHFTMWALIRDSLAQKYIGMTLEDAIKTCYKSLGLSEDYIRDYSKETFIECLKREMKAESDKGAMGDEEQNSSANNTERTSEGQMRANKSKASIEKWVRDALDKDFIINHSAEKKIELATTHILHAIRAVIFRKDNSTSKPAYGNITNNSIIEYFIDGTLSKFTEAEVSKIGLKYHMGKSGINPSTKLKDVDLANMETVLKSYNVSTQNEILEVPNWEDSVYNYEDLLEMPQTDTVKKMLDLLSMEVDGEHPYLYYGRLKW